MASKTSASWLQAASSDAASVLNDHAHCEKKAATMAISLLNRYPARTELVERMAELAEEEMGHFRMVIAKMKERGVILQQDSGDRYAQQLHERIRKQEPHRLLDTLIVCSLIEARSCERFKLLSESALEEDLRIFYRSLLESEARHRSVFLSLARLYFEPGVVSTRLDEFESIEAAIVGQLRNQPLMHG
ncbi:MAG: tRNA-(ms[2]io[6]A)-hydroxylase [Bacteroidota bacterium]|nr:tRNA-(ms[2]io[6]A)-hydroxylase [Bacteroidota bacterium]